MVTYVKPLFNKKLLYTALLALSLQNYTAHADEVETTTVSPNADTPTLPTLPNYTTDIIAQMIQNMIDSSDWQKEAMTEIYQLSQQRLIWINNEYTDAALKLLEEAPASKGLHKEYYNSQWLNDNWQQLKAIPQASFEQLALFDATLSNSLLSYFSDVHYGRVNPQKVRFDFKVNKEHLKLAQQVLDASKDGSFTKLSDSLESKLVFYLRLKKALNQYQQAAQQHKDLNFKLTGLKSNRTHAQIPQLRQLLTTLGDTVADKSNSYDSKSEIYDEALVAGVKNFQHRHGLATNGILTKATVAALNVPLAERISQIELGLERLRWVPEPESDRFVLVNIPSFRLWAFDSLKDEKSEPVTMRVVVGKAGTTPTPSLSSTMNQIEFRPTWTVPQSIIKNEMLSKLENNPGYFAKRNMKVTYHEDGRISIRQASGDHNALGLVKFLFPNNHSVYFHDTPQQKFFGYTRRDFSHGCVRLAEPDALALFALKEQPGNWTKEKIRNAMHRGNRKRIALDRPIPIVIFYGTAIDLNNHGVTFFQDVYGHDKRLKNALSKTPEKKTLAKAK